MLFRSGAEWAVAFTEEGQPVRESYVNLIPTPAGGTHDSGLRDGLFHAVKNFIELHALLPKGVKLMSEDVFARASYVLSAKVLDPQFQGQIKERLNNRDALRLVSGYVRPALELWLNAHVEHGKRLAELVARRAPRQDQRGLSGLQQFGQSRFPGCGHHCRRTGRWRAAAQRLAVGDSRTHGPGAGAARAGQASSVDRKSVV